MILPIPHKVWGLLSDLSSLPHCALQALWTRIILAFWKCSEEWASLGVRSELPLKFEESSDSQDSWPHKILKTRARVGWSVWPHFWCSEDECTRKRSHADNTLYVERDYTASLCTWRGELEVQVRSDGGRICMYDHTGIQTWCQHLNTRSFCISRVLTSMVQVLSQVGAWTRERYVH